MCLKLFHLPAGSNVQWEFHLHSWPLVLQETKRPESHLQSLGSRFHGYGRVVWKAAKDAHGNWTKYIQWVSSYKGESNQIMYREHVGLRNGPCMHERMWCYCMCVGDRCKCSKSCCLESSFKCMCDMLVNQVNCSIISVVALQERETGGGGRVEGLWGNSSSKSICIVDTSSSPSSTLSWSNLTNAYMYCIFLFPAFTLLF